jgi:ligand-binding SRPBCC domain-containing protein
MGSVRTRLKTFRSRFRVHAPLADVVAFHRHAASMAAITPPPVIVRIHEAPIELAEGSEMDFTLWLGPLPIRWRARIEAVDDHGFRDRQLVGPFRHWLHTHRFVPVGENTTEVRDTIELALADRWPKRLIGLGLWLSLPVLFAYRRWQTRRLLTLPPHRR